MTTLHDDTAVVARVRALVVPIVRDLRLDLYDVERRGGTMRVVIDTPAGSDAGIDLDTLALATRLVSRELDHADPIPGRYTLEVTSPGVERALRTPEHYRREIGKTLNVRLRDASGDDRRVVGVLVTADDHGATLRIDSEGDGDGGPVERTYRYDQIDRARTVFEWGPQPKRGGKGAPKPKTKSTPKTTISTAMNPQRPDAPETDAPAHTDQEEEPS